MGRLILGFEWYVVFLFSIVVHEAAHAVAAFRLGDATAYHGGQVSLDPLPHIRREPFGTVFVPILSFALGGWMIGWASAPYDRHWALRYPRRAALMALAGPLSNLLLVLAAGALIRIGVALGTFMVPQRIGFTQLALAQTQGFAEWAAVVLSILFTLNLVFLVFNLIPLPPLDGSAIATLLMNPGLARSYLEFTSAPMLSLAGLMIAWRLFDQVFGPLQLLAVNLLYFGHATYGS